MPLKKHCHAASPHLDPFLRFLVLAILIGLSPGYALHEKGLQKQNRCRFTA